MKVYFETPFSMVGIRTLLLQNCSIGQCDDCCAISLVIDCLHSRTERWKLMAFCVRGCNAMILWPWRRGLVVTCLLCGAVGREIETRQGIGWQL
jgi:hypothetical protein